MKLARTLWIGSVFILLLIGCGGSMKGFGLGAWPVYGEPAPVEFSAEEKVTVLALASEHPDLFKKLQGQLHAYRAIVQTHNKKAIEVNKAQLKALGHDDAMIKKMYPDPVDSGKQ